MGCASGPRRHVEEAVTEGLEVSIRSWDALPNAPLQVAGPVTAELVARGIGDFRAAARYVQALPYGRTANRADFGAVLREGRGTCSTKHALRAALAHEQQQPVTLTLGIYDMHERNTPGVGLVLARHRLASLPEAHCYLTYLETRVDVTRAGADPAEPIAQLRHEETIVPEQIGAYKVALHRRWMQDWVHDNTATLDGRSFEEVWRIREECIAALAQ